MPDRGPLAARPSGRRDTDAVMSEENVSLIRRICELHAGGEFKRARKLTGRKMQYEMMDFSEVIWPLRQYGDVLGQMRDYLEAWDAFSYEYDEFIDANEARVISVIHIVGRGKGGGTAVNRHFAEVWSMEKGKPTHYQVYRSRAEGLMAVGLDPTKR
jgi:hypothetical protein